MSAKISVLLPCLNARPFLEPRIDSLLAQTHTNWEAIVLDSQSHDGSWEFLKSVAATDSRFQLHQVPREGVYAALNRGVELATGEFLYVATCDDTMSPEFLATMLEAFARCPEAGIAASDARLINRDGNDLSAADAAKYLPARAVDELLNSGTVRTALPEPCQAMNYRPPPHDCLLHFDGRSVYLSLTQVVVRMALARAAVPFATNVGSIADFGWLLRLTNIAGTVHVPKKLATWRFHGNQLSIERDDSRPSSMRKIYESALPDIYQGHRHFLSRNDCALLLLPWKSSVANPFARHVTWPLAAAARILVMFVQKPASTLRALRCIGLRGTLRRSLAPILLVRERLAPKDT